MTFGSSLISRCAALDLADKGVRVNAVNPGVIVTEVHKNSGMSEEAYQRFLEHSKTTHALGRVGTADEVADLIGSSSQVVNQLNKKTTM